MDNSMEAIKVLKEVGKISEINNAVICKISKEGLKKELFIKGTWSFRNYSNNQSNLFCCNYLCVPEISEVKEFSTGFQDKRIILSSVSPCSKKEAFLFQDDDATFLNITYKDLQTVSINLKEEDAHGKVYKDETLSSFCWSPDSKFIAYVAEKKIPKATSFMQKKPESNERWGEKYAFVDDWGEQMSGQSQSSIVVIDSDSEIVKSLDLPEGLCGGEVVWSLEETLVGVAYVTDPSRCGLIYCKNRQSLLFSIDLEGTYIELTERGSHVQTPRFSPDGSKLIYLENPVGGPHVRASQLRLMNWKEKTVTTLIDYVDENIKISEGLLFYGLYGASVLPLRCWSEDSKEVVISSPENNIFVTLILNIESKELRKLPLKGSVTALDVKDDLILASRSSITEQSQLVLTPLKPSSSLRTISLSRSPSLSGIPLEWQDEWSFKYPYSSHNFQVPVLYFGPKEVTKESVKKRPLIVWPHGGPHSFIQSKFNVGAAFFVRLGYSILFPNYIGSLGQGKTALEALPGNCGNMDVENVYQATLQCLERYNKVLNSDQVVLFGGSHGGFLVTHLSAQHSDLFKVVSTRNPVIDISSMTTSTDIPNWNFVESGGDYEIGKNLTEEILSSMFSMSPLKIIDQVKAPTLMLIGKEDRRVPKSQGIFYHKMLLARGIPSRMFVYDDCHALRKLDVEADSLIQTHLWFKKHLN